MAAAAAEQTHDENWLFAQEAFPEVEHYAEQVFVRFMGNVVLAHETQLDTCSTLMEATKQAKEGDESARRVVRKNVTSDIVERLYKVANQTDTELEFMNGKLQQDGRVLTDIHRNTLKHTTLIPEMHRRTGADIKNVLVVEALRPTGVLDTHDVYIFSTSSTLMTAKEKAEYHLFADTETCSIQRFSVTGDDVLLETAFVAGKATPASPRHDIATIQKLTKKHGVTITTNDGTEIMQYVTLVPKTESPDGIVNMVQRYDETAGGTFYGEAKPQQDYLAYAEQCRARNQEFEGIVETITEQLIAESPSFETPLTAILRLDELSEKHCVKEAVNRTDINTAIFGPTAAVHIEEARFFIKQGEPVRAQDSLMRAQATAVSGSCPLSKRRGSGENGEDSSSEDADEHGSLTFTCSNGHLNRRSPGQLLSACKHKDCKARVKC